MKAFAAAGLIAAASAASSQTEATPTPSFISHNQYYGYGYPVFDHKEEREAPRHHKRSSRYRTNNIDIFAHSSSDESDDHHAGYGHHSSHSSDSHSSHSEDEHKAHKKHEIFLTGDGPDGDHCHEGDYCGKVSDSSDYTESDYQTVSESEEEEHHAPAPAPGCGGRRCARVDFDWNTWGIKGTMDIY